MSARIAQRADVPWTVLADGRVQVTKSKFGPAGSKLLKAFKVPPTLTVKLDVLGSELWQLMDGKHTVAELLASLQKTHPDESELPARLGKFLSTMVSNDLVKLE